MRVSNGGTQAFQKALDDTVTEAAATLHYAPPPAPGAHPGPAPHLTLKRKQRHHYAPTGRLWDHPSLRGRSRRSTPQQNTNPLNPQSTPIKLIRGPPPVGKAGFEVWVLTKGKGG